MKMPNMKFKLLFDYWYSIQWNFTINKALIVKTACDTSFASTKCTKIEIGVCCLPVGGLTNVKICYFHSDIRHSHKILEPFGIIVTNKS